MADCPRLLWVLPVTGDEMTELVNRRILDRGDTVAFHLDNGWVLTGNVHGFVREGGGSEVLIVILTPDKSDPEWQDGLTINVPTSSVRAVQTLGKVQ